MCRKCFTSTGALVAAMLAATISLPEEGEERNAAQQRIRTDMKVVLDEIVESYKVTEGEPNYDKLTDLVMAMGPGRVAGIVRMAGYMSSIMDDINAHGVAAMKGYAKSGDQRALIWLLENASELQGMAVEVKVTEVMRERENDDVSFMRPRGAAPVS